MTEYSKFNMVYRLQKWMDSVPGQTFLNYAYSWGASVVILGTLFKLTHLPGANLMLYLGMGTEVVVFFLSAFDRPFDKTADGMDLAIHNTKDTESLVTPSESGSGSHQVHGGGTVSADTSWIQHQKELSPEMEEAASNYVAELNRLTEMLSKVSEQSMRLTRDSEEMENLNRTLTGICKVYEMQLKSASSQIGTIDQINEQTKHMAEQISELNKIYARMIEAMTANIIKS
ncbi:MAG: gliding motility protein GldL [Prevotella sp.]